MLAIEIVDIGLEFGRFDSGSDGQKELVTGVGGGVSGVWKNPVAIKGSFGGSSCCDQIAHGKLVERREIGMNLLPAAAGKEGDPSLGGVEIVLCGVGFAWEGWGRWTRERRRGWPMNSTSTPRSW